MKTSRNSACTCGSGLKYKQCCGQKEGKTSPMLITVAVLIGGLIIAGAIFVSQDNTQQTGAEVPVAPAPSAAGAPQPNGVPGSPQPPGPIPPGKVWNVEHGHWHDAPGAAAPAPAGAPAQPGLAAQPAAAQPAQPAFTPGPQPPGPVPAGKVWSTEHGHWHDAPK